MCNVCLEPNTSTQGLDTMMKSTLLAIVFLAVLLVSNVPLVAAQTATAYSPVEIRASVDGEEVVITGTGLDHSTQDVQLEAGGCTGAG